MTDSGELKTFPLMWPKLTFVSRFPPDDNQQPPRYLLLAIRHDANMLTLHSPPAVTFLAF